MIAEHLTFGKTLDKMPKMCHNRGLFNKNTLHLLTSLAIFGILFSVIVEKMCVSTKSV